MTKVHSTDEITSPFFPQDFADYLVESGYQLRVVNNQSHAYAFEKDGEQCIQIIRDWIHLLVWNEEEPNQRLADWSQSHQFSGISQLNFFRFAMLMDVIGAVSLKENFRKTSIANPYPLESFSSKIKMHLS